MGLRASGDHDLATRVQRVVLVAGAALLAGSLAAYAVVASKNPNLWSMIDLRVYRWGGATAAGSGPLYDATYGNFPFTYPPMAAVVFEVLPYIPLATLRLVVTSLSILSLLATVWLTWGRLGHRCCIERAGLSLLVAAVALWIEPVQQTLAFGQVNLLLLLVVLADLCQRDDRWWKGAGIGLAAGLKLTPAIFIPYLLLTRRFRAAAVAAATFGLTVVTGFAVLPADSRRYWLDGLFLDSGRPGNANYGGNQSLYGVITRLIGSAGAAAPYWLTIAAVVGIGGLLAAAWMSRRGHEVPGIVTCAVTGLLISPISWSHHWVWIVVVLVLAFHLALRYRSRLAGVGAITVAALFGAYFLHLRPDGRPGGIAAPYGLIWTVPVTGDREYHWHGTQLLLGNLYVVVGLVLLCLTPIVVSRFMRTEDFGPDAAGRKHTPQPVSAG